jgi:hypothetical protein
VRRYATPPPRERFRACARDHMILALLMLALQAAFARWTAGSPWSFVHFLLAGFLFVFLPGRSLVRTLRLAVSAIEEATLALVLGAVGASACYWLSMAVGAPWLFLVWPLVGLAAARPWQWRRPDFAVARRRPSPAAVALAAAFAAGLIPLVVSPIYYRNASRVASGGLRFYPFQDVIFHLGIAHELTHSIPAQAPFLPGTPLSYHYGMDLLTATLAREGLLSVLDLSLRYVPTFFVGAAVLSVFAFARAWLGSEGAGLAVAVLVLFGEDFSFIPGLFRPAANPWAVEFFGMPTIVSLFLLNPMLPALALLFAALFCLARWLEGGGRPWPLVAAVLLAALGAVKVFTLAHALLSLGLAGLFFRWRAGDGRLLAVTVLTALLSSPLLALSWLEGGPKAAVQLHPWPYVPAAVIRLGLWESPLGAHLDEWLRRGHLTPAALLAFFGAALPLYLIGSLGLRVIGLPEVAKAIARPSSPLGLALALFVVAGPVISLTCAVTPATYPARAQYNNAVWFYVQSKYVAWVFVVPVLARLWRAASPPLRPALVAAVAALSLPSTVQYLAFQLSASSAMTTLDRTVLDMTDFLERNARPGTVVLTNGVASDAVLALTRCRTPHLAIFPAYFISRPELEDQARALTEFWSAWRAGALRRDVLERYHAEYAVADVSADGPGPAAPELELRFQNQAFRVFSVRK